jgi:ParB/RepB/Spo0J family partition protein
MQSVLGTPRSEPLETIATSLGRVRCPQPSRIERIQQSLARHGQLSPLIVVRRQGVLEVVDGFKRRRAAQALGWPALLVAEASLDETAQWATMLLVNHRGAQSMSEIEEALVLRELAGVGLTQVEIAALLERHKSWVSRRIGLIERLHPELFEAIRLGVLHPGVARRLLALPPGNQLLVAAAVQRAALGPRDTERVVSLWQREPSEAKRRALLLDPRSILARLYPQIPRPNPQRTLSPAGQQLERLLGVLVEMAARMIALLGAPPTNEMARLRREIETAERTLRTLANRLGSCASSARSDSGDASSVTV